MENRSRQSNMTRLGREAIFLTPSEVTDYSDTLFGIKRVDIQFVEQSHKRLGPVRKVVKQWVKPILEESSSDHRTMGSESDGLDFCDEAIEKVAKANSVKLDNTQILPEVSASPCAFHTKTDKTRNELLYLTNHHGGHLSQKRLKHKKPVSNTSVNSRIPRIPTDIDVGKLERDLDKYPKFPSALPGHMPSKEFVMTWLLHGSEPHHHFPDLTTPRDSKKPSKQTKRHKLGALRNSYVSE